MYTLFSYSAFLGGCAFTLSPIQGVLYTGVKTPVTYKSAKGFYEYETIGEVEGTSSATSIFGIIASGDASTNAAYKNALTKYPEADGLIDVCVDQTFSSFLGIFASYKTTLSAKAVKWTGEIQPIVAPIAAGHTQADSGKITSEQYPRLGTSQAQTTTPDFLSQIPVFLTRGDLGHNVNLALSDLAGAPGGVGFRFGYKMRRTGFGVTFNPAISYGSLYKKTQKVIAIEIMITSKVDM